MIVVCHDSSCLGHVVLEPIDEPFASVLIAIAKYLDDPQRGGQFYERDLRSLHVYKINLAVVRAGINWLVEKGYLVRQWEQQAPADDPIGFYEFSAIAATYIYERSLESSYLNYEPIALDRENSTFKEALDLTEDLAEQVRGNNGLDPEVRLSLAHSLSSGVALLRDCLPTKEQVEALLIRPLKFLIVRFLTAEIGEMAQRAANIFNNLFR